VRLFGGTQATIRVQRGCPYPCSYCLVHTVNGKKARHRSPGSIVAEIQQLQTQGISNFYFRADTFSLDREWALSLAKLLQQECPRINWVTTTRAERVDLELLSEFRKSGCYGISFGVDVTSTEIGRRVNKLPQLQAAQEAMELCHQTGIIALAYIMIGFIWDTKETLAEAEQFVKRMYPDLLTVHFAHPYPGTQYYDDYQKSALSVLSREAQAMPAGNTLTLTRGELQSAAKRLLRTHYLRRRVLASLTRKILRHRFLAS
ncbi:MAG: radical SAM protein, partial [Bdellovibrionales bacterium]|nr:radical SAM protein [Bdellovibrionales bacterium]